MDIEIPYNVKERKDTGLYNSKLGMWLFLASEVMLFGALFSSYIILRLGDPNWMLHVEAAHLSIPLATLNTGVLILSSVTFVMSWVALKQKNLSKFRIYMGITLLCSFIFLIIKYFEYSAKIEAGHYPSTHNFYAVYFTMTGLHGIHILGGIVVNYYLWKSFADQAIERTSKWLNIATLFCLLLPWASTGETGSEVSTFGWETNVGVLLFITYALSLMSSQIETLKPYRKVFPIFGFIIALSSLFSYVGDASTWNNMFIGYDFAYNSFGYFFFLIMSFITLFDTMLAKPDVTFNKTPEAFTNRVEVAGLYWHFVDLVWIFLFPSIYLL